MQLLLNNQSKCSKFQTANQNAANSGPWNRARCTGGSIRRARGSSHRYSEKWPETETGSSPMLTAAYHKDYYIVKGWREVTGMEFDCNTTITMTLQRDTIYSHKRIFSSTRDFGTVLSWKFSPVFVRRCGDGPWPARAVHCRPRPTPIPLPEW